ncbi:phytanoyl-CoA dioxygenase family protein [Streptomyces sp. NPDC007851]|uniref:phytanoyl-CoA dioxygenase family protein n=1 Tax=Streptomyces sp. NPDC007851 TaxID=3155008 RepID=UPI0033D59388
MTDTAGREAFDEHGFAVHRNVLPDALLDALCEVIDQHLSELAAAAMEAGEIDCDHRDLPIEKRLPAIIGVRPAAPRAFDTLLFCRQTRDLMCDPSLTAILADVLGPDITYQGNGHLRAHAPGPLVPVPWHQDAQFYGHGTELMARSMAQVWIPLVDAGEDRGCLAVVPGSHRWGLLSEAVSEDNVSQSTRDRQLRIYQLGGERARKSDVTLLPMKRGDVVVFSSLLLHTGTENRSDSVRWSVDLRFEATRESQTLTPAESTGYAAMHRRLEGRGYVPLRVRTTDGTAESWSTWQERSRRTGVIA